VKGWSADWVIRYGLPILEADKQHKYVHHRRHGTTTSCTGLLQAPRGRCAPRRDVAAAVGYRRVNGIRKAMVEDPTLANDVCDGGLYSHRHSYQFRHRPKTEALVKGSVAALQAEERELEEEIDADYD
jgi:hypothetical protein